MYGQTNGNISKARVKEFSLLQLANKEPIQATCTGENKLEGVVWKTQNIILLPSLPFERLKDWSCWNWKSYFSCSFPINPLLFRGCLSQRNSFRHACGTLKHFFVQIILQTQLIDYIHNFVIVFLRNIEPCKRMWRCRVSDFRPSEKLFLPRTGEEKITSEQHSLAQKGLRLTQWETTGPFDRTPGTSGSNKYDIDILILDFTDQIYWSSMYVNVAIFYIRDLYPDNWFTLIKL